MNQEALRQALSRRKGRGLDVTIMLKPDVEMEDENSEMEPVLEKEESPIASLKSKSVQMDEDAMADATEGDEDMDAAVLDSVEGASPGTLKDKVKKMLMMKNGKVA